MSNMVIIASSVNDQCRMERMETAAQPLICELMGVIDNAALNTASRVFAGIVLRVNFSLCAYSKNVAINTTLTGLCLREGKTFVNSYNHLF